MNLSGLRPDSAVLLTHDDCDGLACGVMARVRHQRARVIPISQDEVGQAVIELLAQAREQQALSMRLYVTDLGVSAEVAEQLELAVQEGLRLRLFDHHRSSAHLERYPWALIDSSRCATSIAFRELRVAPRWKRFSELVEDIDLGRRQDPRSTELASLAMIMEPEKFIRRFLRDPWPQWSAAERALLEYEERRFHDYCRELTPYVQKFSVEGLGEVGIVCAEQFRGPLGNRMLEECGLEVAAVIHPHTGRVSLRGRRNVDLSQVAQALGGGGHQGAAAYASARWQRPLASAIEELREALEGVVGEPATARLSA